jgi:hypothetical protein
MACTISVMHFLNNRYKKIDLCQHISVLETLIKISIEVTSVYTNVLIKCIDMLIIQYIISVFSNTISAVLRSEVVVDPKDCFRIRIHKRLFLDLD